MPENIKRLRRRIRSVTSTRKITRTMEMIAVAKLRRVQNAMTASRPYAAKIQALVGRLARSEAAAGQPLFDQRGAGGRATVVVVASDRGLCGGYNSTVLREAEAFIARSGGKGAVEIFAVGRRARDFLRKREYEIAEAKTDLGGNVGVELANDIANALVERFLSGKTDRVALVYNSFVSAISYRPVTTQFLPLAPEALAGGSEEDDAERQVYAHEIDYIFEPDARRLFAALLPRYIQTKVYAALLEAMTTEHIARRIAMNSATENCEELVNSLTLRANKARQASITKEILEIVGGAEALKG